MTKRMSNTVGFKQSDLEEVRWPEHNATYTPLKIEIKIFSTKV